MRESGENMSAELRMEKREYDFKQPQDLNRAGEIFFFRKQDGKGWSFSYCNYVGVNYTYNFEDWKFIHDLSAEILRLYEELRK